MVFLNDHYDEFFHLRESLHFLAALAGLVVSLRHWDRGLSPRLAAIGFGLIAASVAGLVGMRVLTVAHDGNPAWIRSYYSSVFAANYLLRSTTIAGILLLVVALRRAWQDQRA